jgi:hypothetical protein
MLAIVYGGLAYVVNPRGDFPHNLFPNLIADVLPEKMHLFQVFQRQRRVEGLILGSSRSMKLNPEVFRHATGKAYFNFAINSAHAEEMLLIYDWVRKQGVHPKVVVIGIDLEALHSDNLSSLTHQTIARIRNEIDTKPIREPPMARIAEQAKALKNACTISYLDDIVRSIEIKANPARFTTKFQVFDANGYEHYPRFEAQRRAGTFDLDAHIDTVINVKLNSYARMTGLSTSRKSDLEHLISEIEGDGGEIVLWLTPNHPRMIAAVSRQTPYRQRMQELRTYAHQLQTRYRIKVYDFSEIARFGGTMTGWYDGIHIDETNADLIANCILSGR